MAYVDFKNLSRTTAVDKVIRDTAFNFDKNDGYQRGLPTMVYKYFIKKTSCDPVRSKIKSNQELAEKLRKQIIR